MQSDRLRVAKLQDNGGFHWAAELDYNFALSESGCEFPCLLKACAGRPFADGPRRSVVVYL